MDSKAADNLVQHSTCNQSNSNNNNNSTSKFVTNFNPNVTRNKKNRYIYEFGIRFWYWPKSVSLLDKQSAKWLVTQTYSNLQEELLNNNILPLNIKDFTFIKEKCAPMMKSKLVKKIISNNVWIEFYGIPANTAIDGSHIHSIVLWTDLTQTTTAFAATFRHSFQKQSEIKETDDQLIVRHSQFFHWAQLLRESVECFGSLSKKSRNKKIPKHFYHGLAKPFLFRSIFGRWCAPTSTTYALSVAQNFAGFDGIVIELDRYMKNVYYFNCEPFSQHSHEKELLIIGGAQIMRIRDIIYDRFNYCLYVRAISIIEQIVIQGMNKEIKSEKIQKCIQELLEMIVCSKTNEIKDIPEYICKLFVFICEQPNAIQLDWKYFMECSFFQSLFLDQNQIESVCVIFDIARISLIFPNVNHLLIRIPFDFRIDAEFYECLLKHMNIVINLNEEYINHIEYKFDEKYQLKDVTFERIVFETFQSKFEQLGIQLFMNMEGGCSLNIKSSFE